MFHKLKQYKELRDKARGLQNALGGVSVEASGASGKVRATMSGTMELTKLTIDETLPREKIESGVREAINDAVKKAQRVAADKIKEMGGLPEMPK